MSTNALVNVKSTEHFSFDDSDVLNALVDGKPHLKAMDVCLAIGYNEDTYRKALIRFVPEKYKIIYENLKNLGVVRLINNRAALTRLKIPKNNIIFLTCEGVKHLLVKSKKTKAVELAKELGIAILDNKYLTKETETLSYILTAFKGQEMKEQYTVDGYRIDLYFPIQHSTKIRL